METGKTRTWFEVSVNATVAVGKHLGLNANLVPKACEEVYAALEMSTTKRNVVSHGDLWGNNFMFSNTVPLKCSLIDFQLIRYYPCCIFALIVIFEKNGKLKHYYSVLRKVLNSESVSVQVPS
ncbi:hypothetical protein K0M31_011543 [Melipona bicolor]|uniref:CHK kinase-like domain-containing protein n=1 Tax=Melipona bicolor TaxID=60889 RepID=A0AA40KUW2_9HYME|nr:hypothetical protein K0M31_011543 [Melipona bicolor]